MAKYKQRLAIMYAATGEIDNLKNYHQYNDGSNLLYYSLKNGKLDCAKFIFSLYPTAKISHRKLASILTVSEFEIIDWVVNSKIVSSDNNQLLFEFIDMSITQNVLFGRQRVINNIKSSMTFGFDPNKVLSNYTNSKQKGVSEIIDIYKTAITRSSKLQKI